MIQRVQAILMKPKDTWAVIGAEPASINGLYSGYIVPLAAIPAIAGFIGLSLIGTTVFGVTYHTPIVAGIVRAVLVYVFTLVGCYIGAVIAEMLAPSFGGVKDRVQGLKLVAYAYTPSWILGIIAILPILSPVVILGSLYGLYLLYLGVGPTMKVPEDKAIVYTIVLVVAMVVISLVIFAVVGSIVAAMAVGGAMMLTR